MPHMTILVIAIALALPAGLAVLLDNARAITRGWDGNAHLSVFLDMNISEQRQQQRRRPRRCSCSAGARAARSCAGTWQHRDVDADHRAPSQRCLASRGGAWAPRAARRSLGRRRGGRGGQRSRGHRPWQGCAYHLK